MPLKPVLQIIHVSDLHFKDMHSGDAKALQGEWAFLAKFVRRILMRNDLFGWFEGTKGHLPTAPQVFADYIKNDLRPRNPDWFGSPGNPNPPPTWLIHTGDLTSFGDKHAIGLGNDWIREWARVLEARDIRSIIGNHDAWAGCHPISAILGLIDIAPDQMKLLDVPGWDQDQWIDAPLVAPIPGTNSKIELYAMDSVLWPPDANLSAAGTVRDESIQKLREKLSSQGDDAKANFRILAVHHPVAYPWLRKEVEALGGLTRVMRMLNEGKIAEHLNNDAGNPEVGPLAHLLLSGHTHGAHPAQPMSNDVTKVKQGTLGSYQLQLVGPALMLNAAPAPPAEIKKTVRDSSLLKNRSYGNSSIDAANRRGQILQFYFDERTPSQLELFRIPIISTSGSKYRQGTAEQTTLYISTPKPRPPENPPAEH